MAQRSVLALVVVTAVGCAAAAAFAVLSPARAADATASIEVQVLGLGKPVAGVVVRTKVRENEPVDTWMPGTKPLAEDSTDATGIVRFSNLQPGRYIVALACEKLEGDWIGGTATSLVEVIESRPAHATLTLRRGGRVKGKVVGDAETVRRSEIRMLAPDAMQSGCPTQTPGPIREDGAFDVRKIPLGGRATISAIAHLGDGELNVWRDVKFDRPDSTDLTLTLPNVTDENLGKIEFEVRDDEGHRVRKGTVELQQTRSVEQWTYRVMGRLSENDSTLIVPSLPAGVYAVRARPEPGTSPWWLPRSDSIVVEAQKTTRKRLDVRLQKQ